MSFLEGVGVLSTGEDGKRRHAVPYIYLLFNLKIEIGQVSKPTIGNFDQV